jgi:hypothetical protein
MSRALVYSILVNIGRDRRGQVVALAIVAAGKLGAGSSSL